MGDKTALHVITKAELIAGDYSKAWDDPDGLARFTPEKRDALLSNPLSHSDGDPVQIIGTMGTQPIGRLDVIPGRIDVGMQAVPCLWTSALFVPEQYRKTLIGVSLILKMQGLCPTVAACGVSHMALPLLEKLQWRDARMPRYLALRRSLSVVQRYVRNKAAAGIARIAADAGLAAHRTLLSMWRKLRTAGLRYAPAEQLSSDMNALIQNSPARAVRVHRSCEWVNWVLKHRFDACPKNRRKLFYVYDRHCKVVAYFIVAARFYSVATHREFRDLLLGSLQDWMVFDASAVGLSEIVLLATKILAQWDVDAIEVCLPPGERVNLMRWGFVPVGELHLLARVAPNSPLARPDFQHPASWQIRPAEGDNLLA
jgi:hypothetical protein